jgi:galactose mutarotase-like enzyme
VPTTHEDTLAGWSTVELTDDLTGAHAVVVPERGGLVARFDVGPKRVLALDEATLADAHKSVRGGIPVLFPTPGRLRDDRWARAGRAGTLPQHGFARTLPWEVIGLLDGAVASVAMRLERDGDEGRWPWPTTFDLTVSLRGATLRLDGRVHNHGATPMPFAVGFHPYLAVDDAEKRAARVPTAATRAFDNLVKQEIPLPAPLDFTAPEVDLHLVDHGASTCTLELPDRTVALSGSPEFTRWVLWTLRGRDFLCVEPWTSPADALNSGEGLLTLAPGEAHALWLEISLR